MSTRIFITGTDTGVGKTHVNAALLAALRARGANAAPMKPVETGVGPDHTSDLDRALSASELEPGPDDYAAMAPYRFPLPASPHLAAEEADTVIEPSRILAAAELLGRHYDPLLIEGAGGLLVPITRDYSTLDLCRELDAVIIVVARPSLGTLNHTWLTYRCLVDAGLRPLGVVVNAADEAADGPVVEDNLRTIGEIVSPCPVVPCAHGQNPADVEASERTLAPLLDAVAAL